MPVLLINNAIDELPGKKRGGGKEKEEQHHLTECGTAPAERLLTLGGVVAGGSLVKRVALGVPLVDWCRPGVVQPDRDRAAGLDDRNRSQQSDRMHRSASLTGLHGDTSGHGVECGTVQSHSARGT